MEFLGFIIFIALLFGVVRFIIYLLEENPSKQTTSIRKRVVYAVHGLRCYSKGLNRSEQQVVNSASESLSTKEYYIFNNVILDTQFGSTEIDHIIISPYGIFVIETKDYSGWIFADKSSKVWTQVLPGGHKYTFQNPFRQNYLHLKTLQEHLHFLDEAMFKSVIVFTRSSEFKTGVPPEVRYVDELVPYIKSFKEKILGRGNYLITIGKISELCQTVDISPEEHVRNLQKRYNKDTY